MPRRSRKAAAAAAAAAEEAVAVVSSAPPSPERRTVSAPTSPSAAINAVCEGSPKAKRRPASGVVTLARAQAAAVGAEFPSKFLGKNVDPDDPEGFAAEHPLSPRSKKDHFGNHRRVFRAPHLVKLYASTFDGSPASIRALPRLAHRLELFDTDFTKRQISLFYAGKAAEECIDAITYSKHITYVTMEGLLFFPFRESLEARLFYNTLVSEAYDTELPFTQTNVCIKGRGVPTVFVAFYKDGDVLYRRGSVHDLTPSARVAATVLVEGITASPVHNSGGTVSAIKHVIVYPDDVVRALDAEDMWATRADPENPGHIAPELQSAPQPDETENDDDSSDEE